MWVKKTPRKIHTALPDINCLYRLEILVSVLLLVVLTFVYLALDPYQNMQH